jgi:hypothetical protein
VLRAHSLGYLRHAIDDAEALAERLRAVDWKVQDVVVTVVRELRDTPDDVLVRKDARALSG